MDWYLELTNNVMVLFFHRVPYDQVFENFKENFEIQLPASPEVVNMVNESSYQVKNGK